MDDLNLEEIEIDDSANDEAKMQQLGQEIGALKAQLNMPIPIRRAIGGAALAYGIAGTGAGALAGALAGFALGRNAKELPEKQRKAIEAQIAQKQAELQRLLRGTEIAGNMESGIMSSYDLRDYEYDVWPFEGEYADFMGQPSRPFALNIFGVPKSGKSTWCFKFAQYLANFGPVLYVAAEEGFSMTLQHKLRQFAGTHENLDFANFRTYEQINSALQGGNYDFCVIDSINFIRMEVEQLEDLKKENPTVSIIAIMQATKNGQFRGSQEFMHNCDVIVKVDSGVAYHTGRFAESSEMNVFDTPQPQQTKKAPEQPTGQFNLFDDQG